MALIIIEGVDRTGKTTLANNLKQYFERRDDDRNTTLLHFSAPEKPALEEYLTHFAIMGYDPARHNLIIDRHYLGEAVWPNIFGRKPLMSGAERALIELFLISRGALLVLAERDSASLREAMEGEPIDADQALRAQRMFEQEFDLALVTKRQYEHTKRDRQTEDIALGAVNLAGIAAAFATGTTRSIRAAVELALEAI